MKKVLSLALAALTVFAFAVTPAAAVSQAGGISLTFPVGSRYNALGEAGTALSNDQTAQWWNPGGFAFAADRGAAQGLHVMYTKLVPDLADDVFLTYLAYGYALEGWGMVGINLTYLDQGEQVATDILGTETGHFSSKQYAIGLSWGVKLTDQWGVGLGAKYFRDELAPDSVTQDNQAGEGDSWAFDFGARWKPMDQLALGATFANLGPNITFVDEAQSDPMPFTFRLGVAYQVFRNTTQEVTAVFDYLDSLVAEDETVVLGAGVEWGYAGMIFGRAGWKHDPEGDIKGPTFGAGFDVAEWIDQNLTFDYANVPQAESLANVHRFSLSWEF